MTLPSVRVAVVAHPDPATEYALKGIGKGGAASPPAAIANTVRDTLLAIGAEVNETPITSCRVMAAIARVRDRVMKR
jgi:aerobic carbon-monoxide dehydrogenase large subunit